MRLAWGSELCGAASHPGYPVRLHPPAPHARVTSRSCPRARAIPDASTFAPRARAIPDSAYPTFRSRRALRIDCPLISSLCR